MKNEETKTFILNNLTFESWNNYTNTITKSNTLNLEITLSKSHLLIIGETLYTNYGIILILGGINLLVAMVGVIYLIILNYPIRKLQSIVIQSKPSIISYININFLKRKNNTKQNNIELYYFKNKQQNYIYRK